MARAFARVLGTHGQGGATIAAVAAEAGIAPALCTTISRAKKTSTWRCSRFLSEFRRRLQAYPAADPLDAYVSAALALDERSDVAPRGPGSVSSRRRSPTPELFAKVRRMMDAEVAHVERRSRGTLSGADASAVLAFVVGALVFGAFAPRKTAGFAAPSLRRGMLSGLRGRAG